MKVRTIFQILVFCVLFLDVGSGWAACGGAASYVVARGPEQRHFDLSGDGCLNWYEASLHRTYLIKKYPLVVKNRQIPYDYNKNRMLDPYEWQRYQKDVKAGTLKKPTKKQRAEYRPVAPKFQHNRPLAK